jgi:hypothetical protein
MDAMNRMTAQQLIAQQGSKIHIFRNQRTGTVGFICGSIQGRCTHRLSQEINCGNSLSINDLEYCVRVFPNTHIPELGLSRKPNIILEIG